MGLNTGSISALSQQFSGEIVTASDEGYDLARRVWNAMIDQRPRLVARPRNASDVAAAVNFARGERLPLAIRGGAHSVAGMGTCDGGVVIDSSTLNSVRIMNAGGHRVVEAGSAARPAPKRAGPRSVF